MGLSCCFCKMGGVGSCPHSIRGLWYPGQDQQGRDTHHICGSVAFGACYRRCLILKIKNNVVCFSIDPRQLCTVRVQLGVDALERAGAPREALAGEFFPFFQRLTSPRTCHSEGHRSDGWSAIAPNCRHLWAKADSFSLSQLMGQCHGQNYKAIAKANYALVMAILPTCWVNCLHRPLVDTEQRREKMI